jgi:hypothetical protein
VYTCPHCGERGISGWQKAFMRPFFKDARCKICRKKVGVSPLPYYLIGLPIPLVLLGIYLYVQSHAAALESMGFGIFFVIFLSILGGTLALVALLHLWLVPLVGK